MTTDGRQLHRILLACLVIIAAAYWAGGAGVSANQLAFSALQPNAGAGKDVPQANVGRVMLILPTRKPSRPRLSPGFAAVANILTKATEYDFSWFPFSVEGAGSAL